MRIGLDVCGGDFAPDVCIKGAVLALSNLDVTDTLFLFGDKNVICRKLLELGFEDINRFEIIDCEEIIEMEDSPIKAFTSKPNSSLAVGFRYLQEGLIDSFASAGNTGAMLVGAKYSVGLIESVVRPILGALMPKENGGFNFLLDVGTNPDAKPEVLEQFAVLGYTFAKVLHGISNPKVGLLNIGEEEHKGSVNAQATFNLLRDNNLINFIGNVEGRDLLSDKADVFVCDGFVGNIVLKYTEAFYSIFERQGVRCDFVDKLNYENYGGCPLLGANGIVIVGHGISNEVAIKNMILQSRKCYEVDMVDKLRIAIND